MMVSSTLRSISWAGPDAHPCIRRSPQIIRPHQSEPMKSQGVLVLCLWLTSSCASAPPVFEGTSPDADMIRRARNDQNAAIAARDLNTVASFWTSSVVVTAGLGASIQGRDAYRRAFEQDSDMTYRRDPVEIQVSSDYGIAWEHGKWTGTSAAQAEPLLRGRYSAQWVKVEGQWLIRSELFVPLECSGAACNWPVSGS